MCMLKISRSDERCEVQSQQPYASHTCTHSTSSTSDDQSHINAKGYAASLQFILIFVFLLLFSLWVRWRFSCMRNTDTLGRASPFDGLNQNTLYQLSLSLAELPLPNLSFPNYYGTTPICTPTKLPFRSRLKHIFLILHMDEITGRPQLMTITQKIKHVLLLHQKEHRTSSIVIITIIRYVLLLLCF